jgi:hypothetical protein
MAWITHVFSSFPFWVVPLFLFLADVNVLPFYINRQIASLFVVVFLLSLTLSLSSGFSSNSAMHRQTGARSTCIAAREIRMGCAICLLFSSLHLHSILVCVYISFLCLNHHRVCVCVYCVCRTPDMLTTNAGAHNKSRFILPVVLSLG